MGVVYEAYDCERDMQVALKTLRHVDATSLYRFKREFRLLANVSHPNIVALYDLLSDDGQWLFTMEVVEGLDLVTYLQQLPVFDDTDETTATGLHHQLLLDDYPEANALSAWHGGESEAMDVALMRAPVHVFPVDEFVDIEQLRSVLGQLASALHALHAEGLVHRDLKPTNMRVTNTGHVVLMDFGVAARTDELVDGLYKGTIAGTPAYMAPEQAVRVTPTASADWYAFGVLMFEAMTGRLPFSGTSSQVMRQKQRFDAPRPSAYVSGIPDELETLCFSLLSREPSRRPDGLEVLERLGVAGVERLRGIAAAAERARCFVGRAEQCAVLRSALDDACRGGSRLLFLEGPSGIGKTHLVERLVSESHRSYSDERRVVVLASSCHEREHMAYNAFDGLLDALSQLLRGMEETERIAIIPDEADALAQLFPVLLQVPGLPVSTHVSDAQNVRERAIGALRSLLHRLARTRPVLMILEDLHWADDDSVEFLRGVVTPMGIPGAMVLGTVRLDIARASFVDAVRDWQRQSRTTWISIPPLSDDEQRELLYKLTADAAALASVDADTWRHIAGHPRLLVEIARHIADIEPERVDAGLLLDQMFVARIARLPDAARTMLQVLVLVGEPSSSTRLGEACSLSGALAERASRALLRAHLIRITRATHSFLLDCSHDRLRDVVVASLSEKRKRALHSRIARALQIDPDADIAAVVRHFEAAGAYEKACSRLLEAAQSAMDELLFERAAILFERVLTILQSRHTTRVVRLQCRAHIGLASCMRVIGGTDDAVIRLERAQALAERHELLEELAEIHYVHGSLLFPLGRIDACLAEHEQAMDYARRAGSPLGQARASSGIADALYMRGRLLTARQHYIACVARCTEHGLPGPASGNAAMAGWTRFFCNELEAAVNACRAAAENAAAQGNDRAAIIAQCGMIGQILIEMGRESEAVSGLLEGLRGAEAIGALRFSAQAHTCLGVAYSRLGRHDEARLAAERGVALCRESGSAFTGPWALSALAYISREDSLCRQLLAEAAALLPHSDISHNHLYFHRYAIDTYLSLGELDLVLQHAQALEQYTRDEPLPWSAFFAARARALTALRQGRPDAKGAVEQLRIRALSWGHVTASRALSI